MAFDFPDVSSRRGDELDRFRLFVEQLAEGVRLLDSGRTSSQRMALVAFDMLAEGLLFRHIDTLFLISDEPYRGKRRTFTATERGKARESFNKRVSLASEELDGAWPFRFPPPILDSVDAAIFRVAHHYRNPVYHRDRHNPALIEPVGKLYGRAVGRAFVRSQRSGYGVSCSAHQLREFERLGWASEDGTYFRPYEAAQAITSGICGHLDVNGQSLRAELADDIAYRCAAVDDDIEGLRNDGLTGDRLARFLADVQDWAASRGDEKALRLQAQHQDLEDAAIAKGEYDEATLLAMRDIERQQWDHVFGLDREPVTRVDLETRHRIRRRGERLRGWPGEAGGLLEQYQRLDAELELLEEALDFMIMQWDAHLQMELDAVRGK